MLTLSLLRHGKSSWDDADLDDHERPLSKRGRKAAALIGKYMSLSLPAVTRVLCSDSVRTRATLMLVLSELQPPRPTVSYEPSLYLAAPDAYLSLLSSCVDTESHVLMIGHNPGIHMLALALAGEGDPSQLTHLAGKFPTGALAVIEFDAKRWRNASAANGRLSCFVTPKQLA